MRGTFILKAHLLTYVLLANTIFEQTLARVRQKKEPIVPVRNLVFISSKSVAYICLLSLLNNIMTFISLLNALFQHLNGNSKRRLRLNDWLTTVLLVMIKNEQTGIQEHSFHGSHIS